MVNVQYWLDFLCFVLLSCNVVRTQVHGYAESCLFTGRVIEMKLFFYCLGGGGVAEGVDVGAF